MNHFVIGSVAMLMASTMQVESSSTISARTNTFGSLPLITDSGSSLSNTGTIVLIAPSSTFLIQTPQGEIITVEVDESATIGEVSSLMSELAGDDAATVSDVVLSSQNLRLRLTDNGICKKLRPNPRSYEDGVSAKEAEDIGYIVKTLSNSALTKLKSEESSLKRAGDRIDQVHPLQFLLTIFTNEELKVCLRNLEGRSWVWKDFLKGLTESLEQEYGRDNLMPYLDDFASQLNIDTKVLMPTIKNGRWDKFVTLLISIIPRAPGSDRYDM